MRSLPMLTLAICACLLSCSESHEQHEGDHDYGSHALSTTGKEYYEHRVYEISTVEQHDMVVSFVSNALIPAYHKQGISTVGAFIPTDAEAQGLDVHVLVPLQRFSDFESLYDDIYQDDAFLSAASRYLNLDDPEKKAYDRINSRLMVAFDSMTHLAVQETTVDGRVFELRSYESFSELKGRKKVAMFDEGGEVTIFRDLGFEPVFFAEALTGDELPNLVYMVTYDSEEARAEFWDTFREEPRWVAIKDLPEYANTVSKIHSYILKAIPNSDIL